MKPYIVTKTKNKNFLNMYALIKTNDSDNYEYYVI